MSSSPGKRRFFSLKNRTELPGWLAWLIAALVKLWAATLRVRIEDPKGILRQPETWPVVVTIWHNRILFLGACVPKGLLQRCAVLVSASRDGNYSAQIIRHFGLTPVRGSSSRRGFRAVRELMGQVNEEHSVILTLDGPRGPRYSVAPGAAALARFCHVPIVPVSLNAPRKWETRSWDRTQIPKPFSRVTLVIGEPMVLPEKMTREQDAETMRKALEAVTQDG